MVANATTTATKTSSTPLTSSPKRPSHVLKDHEAIATFVLAFQKTRCGGMRQPLQYAALTRPRCFAVLVAADAEADADVIAAAAAVAAAACCC